MRWDFRVRHYVDEATQARDPKYDAAAGGVLYPRAATLGGCTAHNAMIFLLAHDSDWDGKEALRFLKDNCSNSKKVTGQLQI